MARRAITDSLIHSRVNGMGRQQQQQQRQNQQRQQLQQVPLPESAPTDNVESPAKRQNQGNDAVPATPITPKVHLMKAHCAWQMANLEGGLGDKGEDWVEQKHQDMAKLMRQLVCS